MASPVTGNPHFAAYTRLTIGARMRNRESLPGGMSFFEFVEALKKDDPVSQERARALPKGQVSISQTNARLNGNPVFEQKTLEFIEKAYSLGLVSEMPALESRNIWNA